MKKHFASIWYDLPDGRTFHFVGMVLSVKTSPPKLFKRAFKFEMPEQTQITLL